MRALGERQRGVPGIHGGVGGHEQRARRGRRPRAIGHESRTCAGSRTRASTSNSRCMSRRRRSSCIAPRRARQGERAHAAEPGLDAGLGRQRRVERRVDARQLGQRVRPRTWETRPAACQVVPPVRRVRSSDEHVGDAELREVIGDRGADRCPRRRSRPGRAAAAPRRAPGSSGSRSRLARCSGIVMGPKDTPRRRPFIADRRPEHLDERAAGGAIRILVGVVAADREADDRRRAKQRAEQIRHLREIEPAGVEVVGRGKDQFVQHVDIEMDPQVPASRAMRSAAVWPTTAGPSRGPLRRRQRSIRGSRRDAGVHR